MSQELGCIGCSQLYPIDYDQLKCSCGSLLEVQQKKSLTSEHLKTIETRGLDTRWAGGSGVWRFKEGILDCDDSQIVTYPEGNTPLVERKKISDELGLTGLHFKIEGMNPTGSFKDRGMTVAMTQGRIMGKETFVCASTGNTSAALACYAAIAGVRSLVLIPEGKIASGKLAQAMAYGARILSIRGDFDAAMNLVQKAATDYGLYLVNSVNPFRLEGQKTIIWEILQNLNWQAPDWIVVPGGNLGNTSAFGKALKEAFEFGWIDRIPKLAVVQAEGANPFYQSYIGDFSQLDPIYADTVATAIRIGNPVNYPKAVETIQYTNGIVVQVSDEEILSSKFELDSNGIGCEPASACSLAGAKFLRKTGHIKESERVVCILTGHVLKDPDTIVEFCSNKVNTIDADMKSLVANLK